MAIACVGAASCGSAQTAPNQASVTHFVNGLWFDGSGFVRNDFYAEGAVLTHHPDARRSYATVDLHGG